MEIWKGSAVRIAAHIKLTQHHLYIASHRDELWKGERIDRDLKPRNILKENIDMYVRVLSERLIDVSMIRVKK